MDKKDAVVLVGLLVTILFLTGTVAGATPRSPILAAFAPILALALMTWYLIILIAHRDEVITALAAILLLRRRGQPAKTNLLLTLVSYGVLIGLAIIFLSSGIPQRIANGLAGIINATGSGTQISSPPVSPIAGLFPTAPIVYYGAFVFVAIFVVSLLILIQGFRLALQNRGAAAGEEEQEVEVKQDVADVVQQAIKNLKVTEGYHETILQCYQRMCKILSDAGIEPSPSETAREFAEDISLKLRVGSNAVQGLTFLFEEARYSAHQITEQKRIMALRHLESLQQALSANVGVGR
jgi:hypothetical protein